MIFGAHAKDTHKRTCRTRKAGLRRAKPQIQNSEFKIQNYARAAACGGHAKFGNELWASAAGRLRPADLYRGRFQSQAISPQPSGWACTSGLRTRECSLPPGGGCGLPVAARPSSTRHPPQQTAAAARSVLTDRFHTLRNDCRNSTLGILQSAARRPPSRPTLWPEYPALTKSNIRLLQPSAFRIFGSALDTRRPR